MLVVNDITAIRGAGPINIAIGFFDGVHRGHQQVLRQLLEISRKVKATPWVLTFDPHPLKIIQPQRAPRLLTSPAHKLRILEALGIHGTVVLNFDPHIRSLAPNDFLDRLFHLPGLRTIVVGANWRFGFHGEGSAKRLAQAATVHGIHAQVVRPVTYKGIPISSTRIRSAVRTGHMLPAAAMLGRPYSILGNVVPGHHVAARLGWPTANVMPQNEAHPPNGVYAAWCLVGHHICASAAYIGTAPTFHFADRGWIVEVHLLDRQIDLYDQQIEVFIISRIRPERVFPSPEKLKEQISRDIETIRHILQKQPPRKVFRGWLSYLAHQGVEGLS